MEKDFNKEYKIVDFNNLGIDDKYINKILNPVWFLQNPIDAEHKYYILLDYIQNLETNIEKGYLYKEYTKLTDLYKDLQCFKTSFDIINKNKESEQLINYIYNLPPSSKELKEIVKIVDNSIEIIADVYKSILERITQFYDTSVVTDTLVKDARKPIFLYIQKCKSGFYEIYELKKSGKVIEHEYIKVTDLENSIIGRNYITINTENAYNSLGTIVPFAIYGGEH